MVSSRKIKDYPNVEDPSQLIGISPENANHLRRWVSESRLEGVSLNAINTNLYRILSWMREMDMKDAATWTVDDVRQAYLAKDDKVAEGKMKGSTLDGELRCLRKFLKWMHPGEGLENIKRRQTKQNWSSDDIISIEQLRAMRDAARSEGDVRGVAMVMLAYGTGCRVSELIDADIKDVKFEKGCAYIQVNGKTGGRTIPFVDGMPELERWISAHPCRLPSGLVDPDAPLFVTYNTRGHGNRRMSRKTFGAALQRYKTKAGIPDNIRAYPHALRHLGASEDAEHMTIAELGLKYGWSNGSPMPHRYVHSSVKRLTNKVLALHGITVPDAAPSTPLSIQCPRCSKIVSAGDKFCGACGYDFDAKFSSGRSQLHNILNDGDYLRTYYK